MASASDSFKSKRTLTVGGKSYTYFGLPEAAAAGLGDISRLPVSLKILLENLLRWEDGRTVAKKDIEALADWAKARRSDKEVAFRPARVLMQDLTGVPAVVDLAAMRQAMLDLGGDAKRINPLSPVDLVIDHSVMIDNYGSADAYKKNVVREYERNQERYSFLRWGQGAFDNFRVVPPGAGICHQVNLEYLSQVVFINEKLGQIYPDTLVGTDSHTTMVNGLAVLGWGVGGIEAEAAMLGQPMSMLLPEVIGFKLTGALREGTTATDLVLTVVQMLRKKGVVGKFVEFYGDGLDHLPLADRATIGNMAPEYGATCGFFPVDDETLRYLRATGRDEAQVELVEAYAKAQGMWREAGAEPLFTDALELDMSTVEPSLAGPKRPQDRVLLSEAAGAFEKVLPDILGKASPNAAVAVEGMGHDLTHGDVVLAAITSCTNTSNPSVMIAAGLLARNAVAKGLTSKPWVKTSLAPGSKVVADYLAKAGLQDSLDKLGFNVVAFGCTSCIGNSGPLNEAVTTAIDAGNLVATAVLSGNRNFEGRVHPYCKANYLASPPLVVAYALAGSLKKDLVKEPLGTGKDGKDVYLKDIWPSSREIAETIETSLQADMYRNRYGNVFEGDADWKKVKTSTGLTYEWNEDSTYARLPPYFVNMSKEPAPVSDIKGARMLARLGDSITTDHISPAGSIKADGPAGDYLKRHQVGVQDFNSFGARRGNHEVMMRGTFANIRLRNELAPGTEGGITRHMPDGKEMSIFEAAELYKKDGVPLVIFGGKEYGTGSSRDWAAKGTMLLGVRAVIVESFERIHRSNLVGMGLLPLVLPEGVTRDTLKVDGTETFDITGIEKEITPGMMLPLTIHRADGSTDTVELKCRIDTLDEVDYYRHGGILQYVLRSMMAS